MVESSVGWKRDLLSGRCALGFCALEGIPDDAVWLHFGINAHVLKAACLDISGSGPTREGIVFIPRKEALGFWMKMPVVAVGNPDCAEEGCEFSVRVHIAGT